MSGQGDGTGKFLLGLLLGVAGTYFSVRTGSDTPKVLDLPGKIAALPHLIVASELLEDADADVKQRQRAVAVMLKHDSDLFRRVDDAIQNGFTNAVVNERFERRLTLARSYRQGVDRVLTNSEYHALRRSLERSHGTRDLETLRNRMLAKRLEEDELLLSLLQQRHPGRTSEELAAMLLAPAKVAASETPSRK